MYSKYDIERIALAFEALHVAESVVAHAFGIKKCELIL